MKKILLIVIFVLAFLLRFGLIFTAYHGDLNNNISWGNLVVERGPINFYEGKDWPNSNPNQPPLTILMFGGLKVVWNAVENVSWYLNNNVALFPSSFIWFWEAKGMILLVKLPGIIADLLIGYLIYRYLSKRKNKKSVLITALWLFNPVIWYNSSIWGQTDSLVNLLGFLGILFLFERKLILTVLFWTLSFLFKGSLAAFIPVIFAYALFQKYKLSEWFKAVAVGLITIVLISICFHPQIDFPIWFINLYSQRIFPGEIGDLTANAFNFWWLINPGKVLDSTLYLGLSARLWGIIVLLSSIILGIYWLRKDKSEKRFWYVLAFISLVSFLFMTRIHERYLYPFFIPATLLVAQIPVVIYPLLILTLTNLLNLYHLFYAPSIPILEKMYPNPLFMTVLSVVNLAVFAGFILLKKKA
jgi:Gpi18-like mannosyltransferase